MNNAFNQLEQSEKNFYALIESQSVLPDSLMVQIYDAHRNNSVKLYHYKEAKISTETILKNYKNQLTEPEIEDYKNDLNVWSNLENIPVQKVVIRDKSVIPTQKDMAGTITLKVHFKQDVFDFIFDTGANFSTTSMSMAKKLNLKMIQADINIGTSTSQKVMGQLAVCDKFTFGNIDVYNAVFLVLPDEFLIFPQDGYQIYGILGYPVMHELKEIQLTTDGKFIVPKVESSFNGPSNFAMDDLMPMIKVDGKPFRFDTGANHTELYYKFYLENKNEIEKTYQIQTFKSAGLGGIEENNGYEIAHIFDIAGEKVTLEKVRVLTQPLYHDETYYGNIGQDIIQQFTTMIINFDKMFIKFEN